MTARRYEDTVTPEIAPCTDCGVLVDETDIDAAEFDLIGDWICDSCASARLDARTERESLA